MKSYKDIVEALKGKQHKIDKNKNGQIDAQDFKLLRKEENELEESEERMARSDYKMSPSGRKSHKEIVFNNGNEKEDEKKEMKEEMTDAQMKKREEIVKSMKKDMAGFKDRYGDQAKSVMYATATKMAMKEEAEELDEKSDQAKRNKMMKNMMDASRGARYKLNNPVPDAEPEHKTAQAHNKAIGRALRNEESEQVEEGYYEKPASAYRRKGDEIGGGSSKNDVPFDGPYTKVSGSTTDKSGAVHSPMSKVRHLARMAMKKQMKEQFDIDVSDEQADTILDAIDEQAPVAPVPGDKWKNHAVMVNGKQRVVIQRKNVKNYPEHEGWKEVSPGHKIKEDDEVKFSYTELMMMLEYESKGGVYRHTGTYGSEYAKKEREKDEKGFDADDKPTTNLTKRGRGRPAGSKSGARGPRIK